MKRFWIMLLAVAMALVIAIPAGAGKPNCTDENSPDYRPDHPTCNTQDAEPPPPVEDVLCAFRSDGVLLNGVDLEPITLGVENTSYRCKLIAEPSDSFEFTIGTVNGATALLQPMIAITDAYPSGDMCFREFDIGRKAAVDGTDTDIFPEVFVTYSMGGSPLTGDNEHGECDFMDTAFVSEGESDTYTLTFQTGKAKGGTVQLEMTDTNGEAPMQ